MKTKRIIVPKLLDRDNFNAQVLNTKAMLSHFNTEECVWIGANYGPADVEVVKNPKVRLTQLWPHRLWMLRMWLMYLQPADMLFYPGVEAIDLVGVRWRKKIKPHCPIIATLEGLIGDAKREKEYSTWAGHPVFCQQVSPEVLKRVDEILDSAEHIIAISSFLARMGKRRYGDKFSVLPLGINTSLYYSKKFRESSRMKVVTAGSFQSRKRPELFFDLACRYPKADFIWYGEGGDVRVNLQARAKKLGVDNLKYPGALAPDLLSEAFRAADIFVMPSNSEGVPKVTQEAAACGLAQVVFGFYEAPSVIDGQNGFVVWDDESFIEKTGVLLDNPILIKSFGKAGVEMSKEWRWDVIAPRWENLIVKLLGVNK